MTYSASEFVDDIVSALDIDTGAESDDAADSESVLADFALDEIERLHGIESAARALLNDFTDGDLVANLREALARPKMEPRDDEDDEDGPSIGDRDTCTNCGLEVEWTGEEWHDRGGDTHCGIAFQKPGAMALHTVNEEEDA